MLETSIAYGKVCLRVIHGPVEDWLRAMNV